jgi:hypothetical protein
MRTCLVIVISILLLSGCGVARRPHRGSLINQWETHNNSFKVRISEYDEKDAWVSGAYYVFESAPLNSDTWQPIMTFRHDDQVGIPKDQVRFVDQQIGYAFMGWMFAITKDGGSSWAVWDAAKDLPNWQCCNYGLIRDVSISADGSGVMKLNPISQRRGEVPELRSQDYGQYWSATGKAV